MKLNMGLMGRLAIFATAVIWGTSFVVLKNTLDSMGTLWVLAIRFTVSAFLLCLMAGRHLKSISKPCIKGGVMMGVFLAAAYIVQTYGLLYTTPGKNAFLTATYCVLTPFLAWLVYKRKPGMFNVVAAVFCIAGVGFVSLNEGFSDINIGDVLTIICGLFYSFQIILLENYSDAGEASTLTAVQFVTAALICWIGALIFEAPPQNVPASAWMEIAYLSVMCTAVCFYLQAWGMKYTPSSTVAMIMTLEAVFGVIFSVLLFKEVVTVKMLIGFVLIFVAVVFSEAQPLKGRKLV